MKLYYVMRQLILPDRETKERKRKYRFFIESEADNRWYTLSKRNTSQKYPACTFVTKDDLDWHLNNADTGWRPFKQKRID